VHDEEAAISEKDDEDDGEVPENVPSRLHPMAPPPPAYGLWRCSVRADPDLLFLQPAHGTLSNGPMLNRAPPSYASEARTVTLVRNIAGRTGENMHSSEVRRYTR